MKKALLWLLLFCFGCAHRPKAPAVYINMADSNRSVKFKGLDYAIISEINRDSVRAIWKSLLPVYRMPADTDMKDYQPIQPGKYQVTDSAIVFTPDTPFIKGRVYFMRYYQFGGGDSMWDYIRGKKRLGGLRYIDLIFKE
ncbi:MAG TPA: hypothetical protein VIM16_00620 [Mucilaginibacter sp.]|jgi:hypothetical protein